MDTAMEYQSVNGVKAKGGSLDGPGPVVVGGTLYVNSGYGMFGEMPGNVLLAFTVEGSDFSRGMRRRQESEDRS
jgi:polyvinyl alcohol dehydrogenase (cytochrome)